jgi:hypothetical protein
VAEECRERGLLSSEYADLVEPTSTPPADRRLVDQPTGTPRSASGVADDWERLVDELLTRFVHARQPELTG